MRSRSLCAGVSAVLVAMSGCAAGTDGDNVEDLKAAYFHNFELRWEVERAVDRVARVCMEQLGYHVHPEEVPAPEQSAEELVMRTFVWTSPDPGTVHVDGYGDRLGGNITTTYVDGEVVVTDSSEYERLPESERLAYQADLHGPDMEAEHAQLSDGTEVGWIVGGCVGAANRVLFADGVFDFLEQRTHATGGADNGWLDDHRVRDVHRQWSACMAERGYPDFDVPQDAVSALSVRQPDPDTLDGAEYDARLEEFTDITVDQAVADLACHERYEVQPTQEAVFWEYMLDYLADYEVTVFGFADAADSILETAQQIIEAGELPVH